MYNVVGRKVALRPSHTFAPSPVPFRASVKTAPFRGATWYPSHNVRGLGLLDVRGISSFTRASHFGERSCLHSARHLVCAYDSRKSPLGERYLAMRFWSFGSRKYHTGSDDVVPVVGPCTHQAFTFRSLSPVGVIGSSEAGPVDHTP